jgi:uncharacterized membrane protein
MFNENRHSQDGAGEAVLAEVGMAKSGARECEREEAYGKTEPPSFQTHHTSSIGPLGLTLTHPNSTPPSTTPLPSFTNFPTTTTMGYTPMPTNGVPVSATPTTMPYIVYAPVPIEAVPLPAPVAANDEEHVVIIEPEIPRKTLGCCIKFFWGLFSSVDIILSLVAIGLYLKLMTRTDGVIPVVCLYVGYVLFAIVVSMLTPCAHNRISRKTILWIAFITPLVHVVIGIMWMILVKADRFDRSLRRSPAGISFALTVIRIIMFFILMKASKYDDFGESTFCQKASKKVNAHLDTASDMVGAMKKEKENEARTPEYL